MDPKFFRKYADLVTEAETAPIEEGWKDAVAGGALAASLALGGGANPAQAAEYPTAQTQQVQQQSVTANPEFKKESLALTKQAQAENWSAEKLSQAQMSLVQKYKAKQLNPSSARNKVSGLAPGGAGKTLPTSPPMDDNSNW
jgi:hypothetical protein